MFLCTQTVRDVRWAKAGEQVFCVVWYVNNEIARLTKELLRHSGSRQSR